MDCPHCAAPEPYEPGRRTELGYRTFRCRACKRTGNERTGTAFNHLEYPTDVVMLVVRWRLQYTLSLRDLATMFLERGIAFTHEAAREWEGASPRCWPPGSGQAARQGRHALVRG